MLWVGTNNYEHTAEQVAGGVRAIAQLLTSSLPKAKIVVLVSYIKALVLTDCNFNCEGLICCSV